MANIKPTSLSAKYNSHPTVICKLRVFREWETNKNKCSLNNHKTVSTWNTLGPTKTSWQQTLKFQAKVLNSRVWTTSWSPKRPMTYLLVIRTSSKTWTHQCSQALPSATKLCPNPASTSAKQMTTWKKCWVWDTQSRRQVSILIAYLVSTELISTNPLVIKPCSHLSPMFILNPN